MLLMQYEFGLTRAAALDHLARTISRMGLAYAEERNTDHGPDALPSTTVLSPYLRRRLLLEEEVIDAALAAHGPREAGSREVRRGGLLALLLQGPPRSASFGLGGLP